MIFLPNPQQLEPLLEGRGREGVAALGTVDEMDMAWLRRQRREARHYGRIFPVAAVADVSIALRRCQSVFEFFAPCRANSR